MLGKLSLTQSQGLTVHTYTAPDDGWRVNSHIIELPSQLLVVDAQYLLPHAREVVAYAEQLAKPITRLYLSHYHPDHILALPLFPRRIRPRRGQSENRGSLSDHLSLIHSRPRRGNAKNTAKTFPPTPSARPISSSPASRRSTENPSTLSARKMPRPRTR